MNPVYLRNEPIRDELVFIGTHLFMTKSFGELEPMKPKTSINGLFCLSCRNRCLVVADDFGERVTEEEKISRKDAKAQRFGREDTRFSNATFPRRLKVRTKFPAIRTERRSCPGDWYSMSGATEAG
jgi:hypothetical protein